jgi:2'-5' RNA ligase
MNRLFVALKIPNEIREKVIIYRNEAFKDFNKFKWENKEKIHLTLKFIGEVKEELTNPIIDSLQFVKEYNSFTCMFNRFGFFYTRNEPRILWISLLIDDYIYELVDKINKELALLSIPIEKKKFQAHLTIKRMKGNEGKYFIDSFVNFKIPEIKFKAGEIALIKSELLSSGSKYTEIKNYPLK